MKPASTHAFVNQFLVGLLVTIGFGGSVGLGTVWMRHQISVVADTNRALEQQYRQVERRVAELAAAVESELSPDVLRMRNQSMQLGLVALTQAQINPVPIDPIMRLAARANQRALRGEGSEVGIQLNFQTAAPAPSAAEHAVRAPAAASKSQLAMNR